MVNVNDFGRITKGKWYYLCCLLLLAVCLLPCLRADAADSDFGDRVDGMAEIQGLRMSNTEDKTRIVIDADQAVTYKKFALRQPDREVVDIPNAWLSPKLKREYTPKSHYVSKIRIAQFDKTTVRLVVEHKVGADNIKVFSLRGGKTPMRIVLDFGNLAPDSSQAKIALPDVKPAPKPQAKPVPKPQAKPQPKPVKPAQPSRPNPQRSLNRSSRLQRCRHRRPRKMVTEIRRMMISARWSAWRVARSRSIPVMAATIPGPSGRRASWRRTSRCASAMSCAACSWHRGPRST